MSSAPAIIEEHVRIDAAARKLEQVAREHGNAAVEELARKLRLHARTEQEVNYPAAILVGVLLRRSDPG
jgi:metal-dependent amidase/aminoacylase/carboxypeptidase family protein